MIAMNPLHILTFGNSITAGWTDFGTVYHPYAGKLVELLEKSLPSYKITIDVGDRASQKSLERMITDLARSKVSREIKS
jgi:hypothetical protein